MNGVIKKIRWSLFIPAAFIGGYIAAWLGIALDSLSSNFHGLEKNGDLISFFFVISGASVSPGRRELVAPFLFLLGAALSWNLLYNITEADSVTPNHIPLIYTYSSGLMACALVILAAKHNKHYL